MGRIQREENKDGTFRNNLQGGSQQTKLKLRGGLLVIRIAVEVTG